MNLPSERMTRRALSTVAFLAVALTCAATVRAASAEDRAAAARHAKQAQEARRQGQLAEACDHLQEVERLDPKLPSLMELADCTEQLGKLVEAQALWAAARDRARLNEKPQSRARAEERLASVEKRVAHLTLQLDADQAAGAEIFLNETLVDASSLGAALALNPGAHRVVVKLAGHEDAQHEVTLAEGESQTLDLAPGRAIAAPPPPPPPPKADPPPRPLETAAQPGSGSTQKTLGLVLGGTGLLSAGVGGGFWFVGYRDSDGLSRQPEQQLLAGQILVLGGAALFVTGAVLFATAPSESSSTRARLPVVPAVAIGPQGTLLGATGRFF